MKTDKTIIKLNELVENAEQSNTLLTASIVAINEVKKELKAIKEEQGKTFLVWLHKHKWATITAIFFGFAGLILSIVQVFCVLAGLYYYPKETRALIQTVLGMLGIN